MSAHGGAHPGETNAGASQTSSKVKLREEWWSGLTSRKILTCLEGKMRPPEGKGSQPRRSRKGETTLGSRGEAVPPPLSYTEAQGGPVGLVPLAIRPLLKHRMSLGQTLTFSSHPPCTRLQEQGEGGTEGGSSHGDM